MSSWVERPEEGEEGGGPRPDPRAAASVEPTDGHPGASGSPPDIGDLPLGHSDVVVADLRVEFTPEDLSQRQLSLLGVLGTRYPLLGEMYRGAIWLLLHPPFPDGIALTAHGLRELMTALPRFEDFPMSAHTERMGDKVNGLRHEWDRTTQNSSCHRSGVWDGHIDKPLSRLLVRVGEFFQWMDDHRPRRRAEVRGLINAFDASPEVLPPSIQEQRTSDWMNLVDYFNDCAHHREKPSLVEFIQRFEGLEILLSDLLVPRPSEEFAEMDDIIRRYEDEH